MADTFSFVWFNFGIIIACGILWAIFLCVVTQETNKLKISLYHDTISSFCAASDSWSNRFLLTFTILIAMNLLCMHTEEYNSRHQEAEYLWIFLLECSASVVFPLVGICYTEGKNISEDALRRKLSHKSYKTLKALKKKRKHSKRKQKMNEKKSLLDNDDDVDSVSVNLTTFQNNQQTEIDKNIDVDDDLLSIISGQYLSKENTVVECGGCNIPIFVSSYIHSFAALYFFFVLTFTNTYYVFTSIWCYGCERKYTFGAWLCLILGIMNIVVLPTFIAIQGVIFLRPMRFDSKMTKLRISSFIFEALTGLIVVALAVISSMKRNKEISFFD